MFFWEAVIALTSIGCGTGVIITVVDRVFDSKKRVREQELRLAQEQTRQRELQIIELRRQNQLLEQQLQWHSKLLEAQARTAKPAGGEEATLPRA